MSNENATTTQNFVDDASAGTAKELGTPSAAEFFAQDSQISDPDFSAEESTTFETLSPGTETTEEAQSSDPVSSDDQPAENVTPAKASAAAAPEASPEAKSSRNQRRRRAQARAREEQEARDAELADLREQLAAATSPESQKANFEEWKDEWERTLTMTDEEIAAYELSKSHEKEVAEKESYKEKLEQMVSQAENARVEAEVRDITATATSAFNSHKFSGRVSDPEVANSMDRMVWDQAMKDIIRLDDKGVKITDQVASKLFRKHSAPFEKFLSTETNKQIAKTIESKSNSATTQVQNSIVAGQSTRDLAADAASKGDFASIFRSLGRK